MGLGIRGGCQRRLPAEFFNSIGRSPITHRTRCGFNGSQSFSIAAFNIKPLDLSVITEWESLVTGFSVASSSKMLNHTNFWFFLWTFRVQLRFAIIYSSSLHHHSQFWAERCWFFSNFNPMMRERPWVKNDSSLKSVWHFVHFWTDHCNFQFETFSLPIDDSVLLNAVVQSLNSNGWRKTIDWVSKNEVRKVFQTKLMSA